MITDERIKEKLEGVSASIPSVPEIIIRVKEISEDPKSSAADLANIVLSDHHLTTRILKLANSAYYAEFSGKVGTVTQAIVLMGFRTVRNVVMSIAIHDTFTSSKSIKDFDFKRFWTKSLGCGIIGKLLAKACRYKIPEEAFIAGFIHDIGKVVISQAFRTEYSRIEKLIEDGEDEISTERDLIGTDHCALGYWLGRKWNMPSQLLSPIQHHHRIGTPFGTKSKSRLVDIIYLAHKLFGEVREGNSEIDPSSSTYKEAETLAGIPAKAIDAIAANAWSSILDISSELGICIENAVAADTIGDSPENGVVHPFGPSPAEITVEMQQMSEQLSSRERQLSVLREASECIRQAGSVGEILQIVLESIFRGLEMGRAILFEIDKDSSVARGMLGFGVQSQDQVRHMQIKMKNSAGFIRSVVANGNSVNVLDATSKIYESDRDPAELEVINSSAFALLPIQVNSEIGMVILLSSPDSDTPVDDGKLESAQTILSQAEIAIEKAMLIEKLNAAHGQEVESLLDTAFSSQNES
jgi:HD-like signal output (HDOD) protein